MLKNIYKQEFIEYSGEDELFGYLYIAGFHSPDDRIVQGRIVGYTGIVHPCCNLMVGSHTFDGDLLDKITWDEFKEECYNRCD